MQTAVSSGVKVSLETRYEQKFSSPLTDNYVFSYFIRIENQNDFPVQLIRRHWFIFDSCGIKREVEGPGVVGEQPVIAPGESYSYNSACDLLSMRGTMHGFYTMIRVSDQSNFRVEIPRFRMETPISLN
jgi:ApaG protein